MGKTVATISAETSVSRLVSPSRTTLRETRWRRGADRTRPRSRIRALSAWYIPPCQRDRGRGASTHGTSRENRIGSPVLHTPHATLPELEHIPAHPRDRLHGRCRRLHPRRRR